MKQARNLLFFLLGFCLTVGVLGAFLSGQVWVPLLVLLLIVLVFKVLP